MMHLHGMGSACLMALLLICAVVATLLPGMSQGQANDRSGVISGRILTEDGQPVAEAMVIGFPVNSSMRSHTMMTDAEGNFALRGLAPEVYRLSVNAIGYVVTEQLGGDGVLARIGEMHTLTLVKGGVITGRVTDAAGEPVVAVYVGAIRLRNGAVNLVHGTRSVRYRLTDDRGVYRHFGLPAGTYVVVANPPTGSWIGENAYDQRIPTYYPSANLDAATEISVQVGAEVSGIDLQYRDIRGRIISGIVDGGPSGGAGGFGMQVDLREAGSGQFIGAALTEESRGVRSFSLQGVPDGEYELTARGSLSPDEAYISMPRRVTVRGADVSGVRLTVGALGSIAGRFIVEKGSTPPDCKKGGDEGDGGVLTLSEVFVRAQRDEKAAAPNVYLPLGSRSGETVKNNGDFVVRHLGPGPHWIVAELPGENWYVQSATMPGPRAARKVIDLGHTALTLKFGEKATGVTVTAAAGAALLSGKISTEQFGRGRWRVYLVPVDTAQADNTLVYYESAVSGDGGFIMRHLAPGKYRVLVRPWPEDLSAELPMRRAAWDAGERAKLRREAEAEKREIELKACQRVIDYNLRK